MTLGELLNLTFGFECSDPRDRIFALLGLAGRDADLQLREPCSLQPGYDKSTMQVYKEAFMAVTQTGIPVLLTTGDLSLLRGVNHRSNEELEARQPSWVPYWDRKLDMAVDAIPMEYFFCAEGTSQPLRSNVPVHEDTLPVSGVPLGVVRVTSDLILDSDIENGVRLQQIIAKFEMYLRFLKGPCLYETLTDALKLTLIAGINCDSSPASEQDSEAYHSYLAYIEKQGHASTAAAWK
jgi:hypothetical protein